MRRELDHSKNLLLLLALAIALQALLSVREQAAAQLFARHPVRVAVQDAYIYVLTPGTLYQVSHQGRINKQLELSDIGVPQPVWQLQALPHARVLLASAARMYLCSFNTLTCQMTAPTVNPPLHTPYYVYYNDETRWFYYTEPRRHAFSAAPIHAGPMLVADHRSLNTPGPVYAGINNALYLADRDHKRLLRVNMALPVRLDFVLGTYSAAAPFGQDRPGRFLQTRGGRFWVIQEDQSGKRSSVVVYDAHGKGLHALALPRTAHPVDMDYDGDAVWLSDDADGLVYRVDSRENVSLFGDDILLDALHRNHMQRQRWRIWHFFVDFNVWLFVLLIGVTLLRMRLVPRALQRDRTPWHTPAAAAIRWIVPDEHALTERRAWMRSLSGGAFLMFFSFSLLRLWQHSHGNSGIAGDFCQWLLVNASVAILMLCVYRLLQSSAEAGTDGRHWYLRDGPQRILCLPPGKALCYGQRIAYGPLAASLNKTLYKGDDFAQLQSLLHQCDKVDACSFYVYQGIMLRRAFWQGAFILSILFFTSAACTQGWLNL